jgi:hypothetical protein
VKHQNTEFDSSAATVTDILLSFTLLFLKVESFNFNMILFFTDPRHWSPDHVLIWLNWAKREFSLEINNFEAFLKMHGHDIVSLGREGFLAIAPPFTGDILWEHLEILQKGE